MKICVVIPTYNENTSLRILLPRIHKELKDHDYNILLIDDTKDNETQILIENRVFSLGKMTKKRGYAKSLIFGLWLSHHVFRADVIIQMDADHSVKDFPAFLDDYKNDVVIGYELEPSTYSRGARFLINHLLRLKYRQPTCGYRLWRKDVLASIEWEKLKCKGFDVQVELLWTVHRKGWKITEILLCPESSKRLYGKSKMGIKQVIRSLFTYSRLMRKTLYSFIISIMFNR